jgi:hypothetical protein
MQQPLIPAAARWLDALALPDHALRAALVRRALADVGIEESASAANRSPYLDEIARQFGSPLGSAWCALILGRWCRDVGVATPPREVGAVRAWQRWAQAEHLWKPRTETPLPGDMVVYDMRPDGIGDHIGVVIRTHARGPRTVEGNTSWSGHSREGVAVVAKPIAAQLVLGYVVPRAAS